MEYYWSNNTINKRINDLRKLYGESKSISEKRNIMNQINYINNFRKQINSKSHKHISLLEAYVELKRYVESEKFLSPYFDEFDKKVSFNSEIYGLDKICFKDDDLVSLMYEFYKTMPKEIFEKFIKNYSKRKSHMIFVEPMLNDIELGYTIVIPSLGKNYLSISKYDCILDIFTTIHEMGHAIFSDLNSKAKFNLNGYKDEVFPIALEFIAADFLNRYYDKETNKYFINSFETAVEGNNAFKKFKDLLQIEKEHGRLFRNQRDLVLASEIAGISNDELVNICNFSSFPELYDQISYIFAIELYYIYKSDPEKFESIVKSIANFDSEDAQDTIDYIISLGITPNEHISEFQDEVREKNKEYKKKYKN